MGFRYTGKQTYSTTLRDMGAGVTIEFEYSLPTARQMAAYHADTVVRRGNTVALDRIGAAVKHLREVLKGFRFPSLAEAIEVEAAGQWVPLSCVPEDPGYNRRWFDILCEVEMKLMAEVASNIFAAVVDVKQAQTAAQSLAEAPPDPDDGATEVSQGVEGQEEAVPLSRMKHSGSA